MSYFHQPVLLKEVLEYLNPQPDQDFVDGTVGGGGHAAAILEKTAPNGRLIGLDRDPAAIEAAQKNLKKFGDRAILVQDNYLNIDKIVYGQGVLFRPSGLLLDLGISSFQVSAFDDRGFSFQQNSPLDMRFGPDTDLTASEIINKYSESKLIEIFKQYGEEPRAKTIARQIVKQRKLKQLTSTAELVDLIGQVKQSRFGKNNPATQVFQALRLAVNKELETLTAVLPKLVEVLEPQGRLAIISFHSLEDRIIKKFLARESRDCLCPKELPVCACGHLKKISLITKGVVKPQDEEINANPRSRSAALRVAEKIN